MANRIQLRRDHSTEWTRVNPTLGQGEPGWEIDTNKVKYGDGVTEWNSLNYSNQIGGAVDTDDVTEASNLYWTTARGNAMVAAYQDDINTIGNIAASYFTGDGSQLTNITTDEVAEAANLYYTEARANAAIDAKIATSDTDD